MKETIYFDGNCGFCHRWIQFVLAHDRQERFDFAPRDSDHFLTHVEEEIREQLPRSILVSRTGEPILTHSSAVFHILRQLGGLYGLVGWIGSLIPRTISDMGYTIVSAVRYRLSAAPTESCPIVQEEFRHRFKP